jgi:hypothetical protein
MTNLINCGTCGYPLTPEERTSLIERDGVMVKPAPVQVSPLEFVTMVMEREHLVGKPLFWAEWPNKENT